MTAVVSGSPDEVARWYSEYPYALFSTGIHPWETSDMKSISLTQLDRLTAVASLPNVVAIGETGLDALRGSSPEVQESLLQLHISLCEKLGKPLVLHVVREFHRILELRVKMLHDLSTPWIFHGFRGKPELARQLLATSSPKSPVYISLGAQFNPSTPAVIPSDRLLAETDASEESVTTIIARIAEARHQAPEALERLIEENTRSVLNGSGTVSATCR